MSTDAWPFFANLPLLLLPWRRTIPVPVHCRHCTGVAGFLLGTKVEKWYLGIPAAGSYDPGTGIQGSFPNREIRGGTIQTTTAAKVWQNQKYEDFITVGEKTAGEDL